jgi:hypothetical protein
MTTCGAVGWGMLFAVTSVGCGEPRSLPSSAELAACRELGGGRLSSSRVELRRNSSVGEPRSYQGSVPACAESKLATHAFLTLYQALELVPSELFDGRVILELSPTLPRDQRFVGIDAHPVSGAIWTDEHHAWSDRSTFLHEIAHLAMAGPRPPAGAARRLALAVEEGAADYFAATLGGDPLVGRGLPQARDLAHAPALPAAVWAELALNGFEAHVFGSALAGWLYRTQPGGGALLEDLVRCLSSGALHGASSPGHVLRNLVHECPPHSRRAREETLRAWAPSELFAEQLQLERPHE